MKALLLLIFLISFPSGGIKTISRLNHYTAEAAVAYQNRDYAQAIAAYEYILNDLGIKDDQLRLDLAHSYFRAEMFAQAQEQYYLLAEHPSSHIVSVVHLQLGNIAAKKKKYKQALSLLKKALLAEPANDAARYNYELLKKYLALHPELAQAEDKPEDDTATPDQTPPPAEEALQPKQKPDADGNGQAETDTDQPDNQGEQKKQNDQADKPAEEKEKEQSAGHTLGDTEGQANTGDQDTEETQQQGGTQNSSEGDVRARTQRERLRQANLSPEKANLLLDAMRNSELQYIQQLPKKATKKPGKGKPDW